MKIAAPAKKTKDCFNGFAYRDSYFDACLPEAQPKKTGEVSVLQTPKSMTFLEMAQHFLGSTDIATLKKHTLTLPMIEKLVKDAEKNGLNTAGFANFAFVENTRGGVSVAGVLRDVSQWRAYVGELAVGIRWRTDGRLMVCNLDTKTLEPSIPVSDLELRVQKLEAFYERVVELIPALAEEESSKA